MKTSSPTARQVAVNHLVRVEERGAYVGRMPMPADLSAVDRRFVTELVAGVTRWRRWLDFVIAEAARRSVEQLEPTLRQIVRLGAYEILEERSPDYAAVNESVELAKKLVRPGAGNLVNAVLRKVASVKDNLPEPRGPVADRMAIRFSHPDWLVRRWLSTYGEADTLKLLQHNNSRPEYALRINTLATTAGDVRAHLEKSGVNALASPYLEDYLRVGSLQPIIEMGLLADGAVAVQDESAGLVVRVLDPQPDEVVVDSCAAPGGKLSYCCQRMENRGQLVAVDANAARLDAARRGALALGCTNVEYHTADATQLEDVLGDVRPERVLVDAPCTGLGVLAKRPDLRWRRRPSDIPELTFLQDRLLDAAASAVRSGGLIVYSTCTIESVENEDRVRDFLDRHDDFTSESVASFVPDEFVTEDGYFTSLPHLHGIDGAFAARLRRKGSDDN